jgi:hypothetical protein
MWPLGDPEFLGCAALLDVKEWPGRQDAGQLRITNLASGHRRRAAHGWFWCPGRPHACFDSSIMHMHVPHAYTSLTMRKSGWAGGLPWAGHVCTGNFGPGCGKAPKLWLKLIYISAPTEKFLVRFLTAKKNAYIAFQWVKYFEVWPNI